MPTDDAVTLFIGNEWCAALANTTFEDTNPADGSLVARIADAGSADGNRAVDAAQRAFLEWRDRTPFERSEYLLKAADILESRAPEWAETLVSETGSIFGKAMYEIGFAATILRDAASLSRLPSGELLPSRTPGRTNLVERVPAGVTLTISPWNFPLLLSMRGVALPIALGNTVVLKPSEHSPLSGGVLLGKIFEAAALPAGVLNVLTCSRPRVEALGDALLCRPEVKRLSFTGSTRVGRTLGAKAVQNMVRPILELGGKDPVIVLEGADIDQAVSAVAFGCFFHQGQICMSTERVIVERSIAEAFTEKLVQKAKSLRVGDPKDPAAQIGPIIHTGQLDEIHAQVTEAVADGAVLLCGGTPEGLYYPPTVLGNVTSVMRIARDETFGPVAPIFVVNDAHHAIEVANDSDFGLSAGVFAADEQQALAVAQKLDSGMVHINDSSVYDEPHCPFGGCKNSGMGRHGGQPALYEFTETRWTGIQRTRRGYPI